MTTVVNDHLALEDEAKVVGLLVLDDTDLNRLTVAVIIELLGPEGRGSLLVLSK